MYTHFRLCQQNTPCQVQFEDLSHFSIPYSSEYVVRNSHYTHFSQFYLQLPLGYCVGVNIPDDLVTKSPQQRTLVKSGLKKFLALLPCMWLGFETK
jgi:hypothetical protein